MSYPKSFVATATISPENVEKLLKALFGEPEDRPKRVKTVSNSVLVKVKSGDGIGFDIGDCVAVTNAKNNVGMLVKANYQEPFENFEYLMVSPKGVSNLKDLIPGRTYIVYDGDIHAFVKYLGHSMVLMVCQHSCDIVRIKDNHIRPHYELSLPVK